MNIVFLAGARNNSGDSLRNSAFHWTLGCLV